MHFYKAIGLAKYETAYYKMIETKAQFINLLNI